MSRTKQPPARVAVRDSRGRPVRGLFLRQGRYGMTWTHDGKTHTRMFDTQPTSLSEAKRMRESFIAALREGRTAEPSAETFMALFSEWQNTPRKRSRGGFLSERTRAHEQHLIRRHAGDIPTMRVQAITSRDVAAVLVDMARRGRSGSTRVQVYRLLRGTLAFAVARGVITANPCDRLLPHERPSAENARELARLDSDGMAALVAAGRSERFRAALALAAWGGLRLGEVRGLRWGDVDLDAGTIRVERQLPGREEAPLPTKTKAGTRTVPILPALDRRLRELRAKRTTLVHPTAFVISTHDGRPLQERNLRRALDLAIADAGLTPENGDRLSWHVLRHSFGSYLVTELELPLSTVARVMGHANAGITARVYVRDVSDDATMVERVLARATAGN